MAEWIQIVVAIISLANVYVLFFVARYLKKKDDKEKANEKKFDAIEDKIDTQINEVKTALNERIDAINRDVANKLTKIETTMAEILRNETEKKMQIERIEELLTEGARKMDGHNNKLLQHDRLIQKIAIYHKQHHGEDIYD